MSSHKNLTQREKLWEIANNEYLMHSLNKSLERGPEEQFIGPAQETEEVDDNSFFRMADIHDYRGEWKEKIIEYETLLPLMSFSQLHFGSVFLRSPYITYRKAERKILHLCRTGKYNIIPKNWSPLPFKKGVVHIGEEVQRLYKEKENSEESYYGQVGMHSMYPGVIYDVPTEEGMQVKSSEDLLKEESIQAKGSEDVLLYTADPLSEHHISPELKTVQSDYFGDRDDTKMEFKYLDDHCPKFLSVASQTRLSSKDLNERSFHVYSEDEEKQNNNGAQCDNNKIHDDFKKGKQDVCREKESVYLEDYLRRFLREDERMRSSKKKNDKIISKKRNNKGIETVNDPECESLNTEDFLCEYKKMGPTKFQNQNMVYIPLKQKGKESAYIPRSESYSREKTLHDHDDSKKQVSFAGEKEVVYFCEECEKNNDNNGPFCNSAEIPDNNCICCSEAVYYANQLHPHISENIPDCRDCQREMMNRSIACPVCAPNNLNNNFSNNNISKKKSMYLNLKVNNRSSDEYAQKEKERIKRQRAARRSGVSSFKNKQHSKQAVSQQVTAIKHQLERLRSRDEEKR